MKNLSENEMINYNQKAKEIYQQNKEVGWWDDPNRCIFQTLQLVSTEIAEATEGERKNLMDDHLPHRKMGEVELADALIRVLDIAGRYGWLFDDVCHPLPLDEFRDPNFSIAGKHLFINARLIHLVEDLPGDLEDPDEVTNFRYTQLLHAIVETSISRGYDIWGAMDEKLEYNKTRSDHKRSNRAKEGGKSF